MMSDYFLFYQKFKNHCNFYQHFKIPLANYNNSGKCVLMKHKKEAILSTVLCVEWLLVWNLRPQPMSLLLFFLKGDSLL